MKSTIYYTKEVKEKQVWMVSLNHSTIKNIKRVNFLGKREGKPIFGYMP